MLIIKLIVLHFYLELVYVRCVNYCEICVNHTLCLFPNSGPGPNCKDYQDVSIKKESINEIVNRINEKRNYVSLGFSMFLPQAANMRKISWSHQLAVIAQRWADQCDQSVHQDTEDYCRDLGDDVRVGQNIASIIGYTSGLNVKSFVDMWYMKSIDYNGSVTFYKESRDEVSRFFTQLIWADTSSMGCGRVKYRIVEKNTTIEKLVCNFAPRGNINGKPVYTIGYPATQCPPQTEMDGTYPGLCQNKNYGNAGKFTTQRPPVSSLLRILNLSNNSVKQEIDPIRSNLRQINYGQNETSYERNQRIRHVPLNNTHGGVRPIGSVRSQHNYRKTFENKTRRNFATFHEIERGHSRMYHGYQSRIEHFDNIHKGNNEDFRKHDFSTEPININTLIGEDYRKYNTHINRCTRKMGFTTNFYSTDDCSTTECYKCTRGKCLQPINSCQTTTPCCINTTDKPPQNLCVCNEKTTTCSRPLSCNCNLNYKCISTELCATPRSTHFRRIEAGQESPIKSEFNLYDPAAILAPRSGENTLTSSSSSHHTRSFSIVDYPMKQSHARESDQNHNHRKLQYGYQSIPDEDYNIYDLVDSNKRKKRDNIDQVTFRPFWQVDEYKNSLDLRSMKYTTLANRKNKKTRRPAISTKPSIITEVITIKLKDLSTNKKERGHISEKYLSFDELMHIRKLSTVGIDQDARKKGNDSNILREDTTTTPITTVATIETPFFRIKHCTRKLTCTWTAFTATGSDGNIILHDGGDFGSRTPPGYVDGCTRTSTCTRDFQDRNKISTIPDPISIEPSPEDEDYCEKRSLNVQRRDSENINPISVVNFQRIAETRDTTLILQDTTPCIDYDNIGYKTLPVQKIVCQCGQEHSRIKRDEIDDWENTKTTPNYLSYGDLYYLVLQKIIKSWEDKRHLYKTSKCSCSATTLNSLNIYLFLILCICRLN